ncbi:MAG: response regulator [candidate division Zixibacteria bacterium]|nr:response regulator [candidate division Zixibacteria bacterium]
MEDKKNVLIVDDEESMRHFLSKILTREGYNVFLAENGQNALDQLKETHIDIILADIKMPGMNGFELLKILKADWPEIGVIMMTGYGDSFTVKDALMLGADEYVTKPFKSHEITLIVKRTSWRRTSKA